MLLAYYVAYSSSQCASRIQEAPSLAPVRNGGMCPAGLRVKRQAMFRGLEHVQQLFIIGRQGNRQRR